MGDQFALKNNQIFVLAEAAGGVYNSDQLRVLCEVADTESAFLKITEDQRIGFMIDPNKLADVQGHVRKSGLLLRSYKAAATPAPRACLGELCTFAQQPALGDALELTTHLLKTFPAPKRFASVGVNGCHRACLGSSTEDVHIVAEESGYKVSIGGKGSEIPQQAQLILENIPRAELALVIEKILAVFYQESADNERIYDVIDRVGLTPFYNALPEHLAPAIHSGVEQQNHAEIEIASGGDDPADNQTRSELDQLLQSTDDEFADMESVEPDLENSAHTPEAVTESDDSVPTSDTVEFSEIGEGIESDDAEMIGDDSAGDLLEVGDSELEEGSLEDVERVRDAIRTELSMSASAEPPVRPQSSDLLDEITSAGDDFDDESVVDHTAGMVSSQLADLDAENQTDTLELDDFDESADHTAASLEYQKPHAPASLSEKRNIARDRELLRGSSVATPVAGRFAIRFAGEQLSIELPSGMSFEIPFESVGEDLELNLSLPDGDLSMRRDGRMLAVTLGKLHLKIPVPDDVLQVA